MDSKGGNPFLMDDYPAADASMASNPFLQDFGAPAEEAPAGADVNPFFNFVADQTYQPPTDSTNPFASFGMEAAAAVPEPEPTSFVSPEAAAVPQAPEPVTTADLFGDEPVQPVSAAAAAAIAPVVTSPPQATPVTSPPSKPSRPPPPPRPGPPPPPRNTKDLILSVTGAMDETSNQMLDRLQATRTPSPTLMHSPSPTPEHSFADLLDVDGSVPDLIHDAAKVADDQPVTADNTQDMLGLFDAPPAQAPALAQETGVGVTQAATDTTLFSPPAATSTLSDNPFSDVGAQDAGQMFEPSLVQEKRPSLTTGSPPAGEFYNIFVFS